MQTSGRCFMSPMNGHPNIAEQWCRASCHLKKQKINLIYDVLHLLSQCDFDWVNLAGNDIPCYMIDSPIHSMLLTATANQHIKSNF